MEDLFRVVQSIELKSYPVSMDKYDIEDIIRYCLIKIESYHYSPFEQIYSAILVQILQKIVVKSRKPYKKKGIKLHLTPAEYYALKKMVSEADYDELPLAYPLLVQLDKQ